MLTPLGKALRKLRIDRGWLLKDMADGIGVAPSFLSGIETGRKAVPPDFMKKLLAWADLPVDQVSEFVKAASLSKKEFKIPVGPHFSDTDREAAALLARFGELPVEERDQIRKILLKRLA
jgi:transcriptional regulator with XRE-family HTH domain